MLIIAMQTVKQKNVISFLQIAVAYHSLSFLVDIHLVLEP
ncbi:Uncharacterised protein [Chryseobacterium indoltheticum]|uniref:Uncharacterized protein n=1 Tax=Chryseobacterium indoltheticum TaxID=254 RepID=A0A381FQ88_9FLAO|nr:Uncharacterised protein [Chryseobacterium indoltheticum]